MTKYSTWDGPETVGDFIDQLATFPRDWPVKVSTQAGGGIAVEHRDLSGKPAVCIFGKNGGRFGENPLTDDEYREKSADFLACRKRGMVYTSIHGDHRLYRPSGINDTCYGTHYDRRVIERMVTEGLIPAESVDIDRVAYLDK